MALTKATAAVQSVVSKFTTADPLPIPDGSVDPSKLGPFAAMGNNLLTIIVTLGFFLSAIYIAWSIARWTSAGDFQKKRFWGLNILGSAAAFVLLGSFSAALGGISKVGQSIFG